MKADGMNSVAWEPESETRSCEMLALIAGNLIIVKSIFVTVYKVCRFKPENMLSL